MSPISPCPYKSDILCHWCTKQSAIKFKNHVFLLNSAKLKVSVLIPFFPSHAVEICQQPMLTLSRLIKRHTNSNLICQVVIKFHLNASLGLFIKLSTAVKIFKNKTRLPFYHSLITESKLPQNLLKCN